MKQRKRKKKQSEPRTAKVTPSDFKRPRRNQKGLLILAVALLGLAFYLNYQRLQQADLPEPLPLPSEAISSHPLAAPSGSTESATGTRFTRLSPTETGVDFVHPVIADHPQSYLYFSSMAAGGTAIGDVNGDGRPDIFIASGPEKNRLYLQQEKPFTFQDVAASAGVEGGDAWSCGATMVDINADGRLDIYVANYDSPNHLFVNLGDGTFRNLATDYDLNITDASLEGVFADYDRDGFLDLYLLTYRYENPDGMPHTPPIVYRGTDRAIHPDFQKYYAITNEQVGYGIVGRTDGLLRNNGDGTFSDATARAGIHGADHGQSATWFDFDQNGLPDLFVGNDFNDPDHLYRNNGDGTFTDIIREAVPHTSWFSMGSDAGDVNDDGLIDFLTTDMSSTTHFKQKTTMGSMSRNRKFLETAVPRQYMRNALLINSGTDRFKEAAYLTGLDSTDWTWSVNLVDLDCDGRLDAFFTNGSVRSFTDADRTLKLSERLGKTEWDIYRDTEPLKEENLAFRNDGDLHFTNVSNAWGLDHLGVSMSAAHGDFDGDGDLDLVVANVDEPIAIYRNDSSEYQRLTVRLHGLGGNRFGLGASVIVTYPGGQQIRELHPSRGFLACNQPILHFGCGDAAEVDVSVRWPSGNVQRFESLATGRFYTIKEVSGAPDAADHDASADSSFTSSESPSGTAPGLLRPMTALYQNGPEGSQIRHREDEFDDYALQPLLPHRLSQLGPALAAADFDRDGDIDYFVGGAAGQPGQLAIQGPTGKPFVHSDQPALEADQAAEDMGAVWLDIDNDNDADLIVASGGNQAAPDADTYLLRLYVNQQGTLQRDRARLPDIRTSAGPIAAADFDADGDVDLFIGGRQIPGQYPLPGISYLLVNENGHFLDRTVEIASGLAGVGMVTGALWTDVDNDRDLDLMVTTEWGAIHQFRNDGGRLADNSALAGLTSYRGWWTGISGADFDGDGDMDYLATNMGLNTKYHATDERPFRLYYGDFEGNGQRQLVEAEYEKETLFPVRGKSCSTEAMPSLGSKFTTYKAFAAASLEEIYTQKCLEDAYQVSANLLASVVLLNDGTGVFDVRPLPREAQIAPGFGVVITELTGDGNPDVFIAQNFFSPQPETGNMDGGLGCLLAGNGDGTFHVVPTANSGIVIPEDATAACVCELNGDGLPDLLVATNDGPPRSLVSNSQNRGNLTAPQQPESQHHDPVADSRPGRFLQVRLEGICSTAAVAGTRISVEQAGKIQTVEVSAGCGYLTQSPPVFFFGAAAELGDWQVKVIWPNGIETEHRLDRQTKSLNVVQPDAVTEGS